MSDEPSDSWATSASDLSLPCEVVDALSIPGIDRTLFPDVIEAFGPLPVDGQVELANELIRARGQYSAHRMSVCDSERNQGVRRKRLKEIGITARRLLHLLHREGVEPQPWSLHTAIALALPHLRRIASERRPNQIWDQGLSPLQAMLTDLISVGEQAEAIFWSPFPKTRGGNRRKGPTPASDLVDQLIRIYVDKRDKFPDSGPRPAFGDDLLRFIRAALVFTVSARVLYVGGQRRQPSEAAFIESDLAKPTRMTDDAIRGLWDRRHKPNNNKV
jgi:hypothetical protein